MSGITLLDLLEFDAGPWHVAADTWHRLANGIDDASDEFISGTRDLREAWQHGTGAAAAAQKGADLRAELINTYPPAKSLGDAFDQHAYAMTGLRNQADGVVASARQAGYTVDTAAGTVTAPASAYMGGNLDQTGRETGALLNDLRTLVDQARAQDDATAGVINRNVPSVQYGFGTAPPGTSARAIDLAKKLEDPAYEPTPAELDELRDLIKKYGKDKAFSYDVLNALGPKGLLQLDGRLAALQPERLGKETDGLIDVHTADTVRDLQNGLGTMLATATQPTGTHTGAHGEQYVPGKYELPAQWTTDLMAAGRSKMDIVDPNNPGRTLQGVYGYQLLGPLLHNGDYDARYLSTVGGDMLDFEMSQGKNSTLWRTTGGENIRLDWTQGYDDTVPAGSDPMNGLMDGLSRNGEAAKDLLTGVTSYSSDGPAGGRLPRLDYLLTDREWKPDVPGGAAWNAYADQHQTDYQSIALDRFGTALEHATTDQAGPDARRVFQSIIYETNVDETATKDFSQNNLIHPELRDSMSKITSAYIFDINRNIGETSTADPSQSIVVDRTHLVRFLADLGKDQQAHDTIANAEAVYAAGAYDDILSGRQDPHDDLNANLRSMNVVSHNYGSVLGALDFGANEVHHKVIGDQDVTHNHGIDDRNKIINFFGDKVLAKTIGKIPVPVVGDLASNFIDSTIADLEDQAKVDNSGQATYDVAKALGAGRATSVDLTEMALYHSGKLHDLPPNLLTNGVPRPMSEWTTGDYGSWQHYKEHFGQDTVGDAAKNAGDSYHSGYTSAKDIFNNSPGGSGK
jgi:hypothetical protein